MRTVSKREVKSPTGRWVRAAPAEEVRIAGCSVVHLEGHTIALFWHDEAFHAVDNRCPHMGFPLDRGTVKDCILTCHWHHARFDLTTGGTFDPWADDLRRFPTEVRDGEVWVDLAAPDDAVAYHQRRVREGLERNIRLVVAKGVILLLDRGQDPSVLLRIGLEFGTRNRQEGWGQGLTILACMMNLLEHLDDPDRPRALYQGFAAVAVDTQGAPPRFQLGPLPGHVSDLATLKRWFRSFIEVRDAEGAERCLVSAIKAGAGDREMADMLFAAATDHRYIRTGHPLDFANKAIESLDHAGWNLAAPVLASLATDLATADRMEEANAWRHPVDLVRILETAFESLPAALERGRTQRGSWNGEAELVEVVLDDDPQATATALLEAVAAGASEDELAAAVTYAAALRIARFHTSNEFADWDTALHTFTFANAVHHGLLRSPTPELLRGVFDAAMSVYLDRFLNVPAARLPSPAAGGDAEAMLGALPALLDKQQRVTEAADLVAGSLAAGASPDRLLAMLGTLLLREDRDFHTIQTVEAAFAQYRLRRGTPQGNLMLVAAARYLAAHAPTARAQEQTFQIARRLHRGERLFEEDVTA